MHDTRATHPWRRRLVLGAALLLAFLALSIFQFGRTRDSSGANAGTVQVATPPASETESAAEKARRAAIAALGPFKSKGVNAADLYADASSLYAALTPEEKNILSHPHDKPDADAAAALYEKLQPIMDLLRRARDANYVDWNMGPLTLGTSMNTRIDQGHALAQVALWESGYRFQSNPDGAVSDLTALVLLGRSECDTMIGLALENSFRTDAIELIAQNAGSISSAASPDIAYIVSQPAAQERFQDGMNGEVSELQSYLVQYSDPSTRVPMDADNTISPEKVASTVQFLEQTDQALGTANLEPQAQFQQWWDQQIGASATLPVATAALKAQELVISREQASMVENAMLAAGIALEQGDQAQFQSIVDPSTGQPFTCTQTDTGFQLVSPTQYKGNPVTLTFFTPSAQ
jgi:hypothetical protein